MNAKLVNILIFIVLYFIMSCETRRSDQSRITLVDALNLVCDSYDYEDFDFLGVSNYYDDESFINHIKSKNDQFNLLSSNIQSLNAKFDVLNLLLNQYNQGRSRNNINVITLQETWLGEAAGYSHIDIPGYNCISKYGSACAHGGLATYIGDDLQFETIDTPHYSQNIWECLLIRVWGPCTGGRKLVIGNVYRPPKERVELLDTFLLEFNNVLVSLQASSHVYIGGDFNLDLYKFATNNRINKFLNECVSLSFFPKITNGTRLTESTATLIDNYFCKSSDFKNIHTGILTHNLSDHQPYFLSTELPTTPTPQRPTHRYYTKMTYDNKINFKSELGSKLTVDKLDKSNDCSAQKNYDIIHQTISDAYTNNTTQKKVRSDRRKNPKSPWITNSLIKSIRTRNKLYKKMKQSLDSDNYIALKLQVKNFNKVLRNSIKAAKRKYYIDKFREYKNDPRKTWKIINSLTSSVNTNNSSLPDKFIIDGIPTSDESIIANGLNTFFLEIAAKLTSSISSFHLPFDTYLVSPQPPTFEFHPVSCDVVAKAIDNLKCKRTPDCDGISTELIKICKFELIEPLTLVINQSLSSGIFPDQLKTAKVSPIYKKGDKYIFDNYRPISILPAPSKIAEQIIHSQITQYFTDNNLFYTYQYGFRKKHSTEYAALQLIDQVMTNIENRKRYISIFMDLSKAFDCIDHTILLQKLSYYGMKPCAVQLIKSYLSNRQQYVQFKNTKSSCGDIKIGVPQGSILGPLLFLIYINDIAQSSKLLSAILYADDSTFSACLEDLTPDNSSIGSIISSELSKISNWLKANKLCLNESKTKYIIFNKTMKNDSLNININDTTLDRITEFNFLGLKINDNLDWNSHIAMLMTKLNRSIGILRRLKHILPISTLTTIYYSLIHPHLHYMLLAWGYDNDQIKTEQKKALRLVHNKHYIAHTDPLFKTSQILKLPDLHNLSQLKFCYRYIHSELPDYFTQMTFEKNNDLHSYFTRNNDALRNTKPRTEYSRKSIRHSLPNVINSLSDDTKNSLYTLKYHTFVFARKQAILNTYSNTDRCEDENCYSCTVIPS